MTKFPMDQFRQAVSEYVDEKLKTLEVDLTKITLKYKSEEFAAKVVSLGLLQTGLSLSVAMGMDRGTIQKSFDRMIQNIFAEDFE